MDTEENKDNLSRYFCVYFISKNEEEITKENKRTRVVEAKISRDVEDILITNYGATYIKSIRDLEDSRYYLYDELVHHIEQRNNFRNSKYYGKEKKK